MIPVTATFGTYELEHLTDPIMGSLFEGKLDHRNVHFCEREPMIRMCTYASLCIVVLLILPVTAQAISSANLAAADPTGLRLKSIALEFHQVPLSTVLDRLAVNVEESFVLLGIEAVTDHGREPLVSVEIPGAVTLHDALMAVIAEVPDYTFEAVGPHLINVYPKDALFDPNDVLNITMSPLDLVNVAPSNLLGNPARFIPELKAALAKGKPQGCTVGPGLSDKAPGFSFRIESATVRGALNRTSEVSIATALDGTGTAFGWAYFREKVPSSNLPAHKWRALGVWRAPKH